MGLKINGSTSGSIEIDVPAAVSGGDIGLTLPNGVGTAGQVLSTNGSGVLSFVNRLEWDQFQLTASQTSDGDMTNWARSTYSGFGQVGSQMSVSSGIFTFPSTGYYLVIARAAMNISGDDTVIMQTQVTTNNSTYTVSAYTSDGNNGAGGARHGGSAGFTFVDVTDVANVKVKFTASSIGTSSEFLGGSGSDQPYTQVTFIRLGDT